MKNKSTIYLQRAIRELPEIEPEAKLWNTIEAQIDFESTLAKSLPSLPLLEPDESTWAKLESRLTSNKPVKKQLGWFAYLSAAACLVLIIVASIWFVKEQSGATTYSYSQEMYEASSPVTTAEHHWAIQEAMGFIQTSCENQLLVCHTPEFQELKSQLDELTVEMGKLKEQQSLYGQEPELIKAQIKLENLQAQITKELIQLILS